MADDAVVAPPPGSLSKLATFFDTMANDADLIDLKVSDLTVTPGSVQWAAEFKKRFEDRNVAFQTKIRNLAQDFRDISQQLVKIDASYQNTEIANADDITRLQELINKLAVRNPGVTSMMPTPPAV